MFVRLALDHEAEELVRMAVANLKETMPGEPYDEEEIRRTFLRYLQRANPTFFFVEHKRRVIGFLQAVWNTYDYRAGFYTVQKVLYVSPENRGTRAAVLLMKEFIAWSQRFGASEAFGGNDNDFQSERTAKFLGHFGFKRIGYAMKLDLSLPDGRKERRIE